MQLVYGLPAFVVRQAITAALRSMSEAKINGAPGNSMEVLRTEDGPGSNKGGNGLRKSVDPIKPLTPLRTFGR